MRIRSAKSARPPRTLYITILIIIRYDQTNLLLLQAQGAIEDDRVNAICKVSNEITTKKPISNVHEYTCNKMVV